LNKNRYKLYLETLSEFNVPILVVSLIFVNCFLCVTKSKEKLNKPETQAAIRKAR
jgi:hypothetical protein